MPSAPLRRLSWTLTGVQGDQGSPGPRRWRKARQVLPWTTLKALSCGLPPRPHPAGHSPGPHYQPAPCQWHLSLEAGRQTKASRVPCAGQGGGVWEPGHPQRPPPTPPQPVSQPSETASHWPHQLLPTSAFRTSLPPNTTHANTEKRGPNNCIFTSTLAPSHQRQWHQPPSPFSPTLDP